MTYLVDGLRVTISGGLTGNLVRDMLVLAGFLVIFLGAAALMVRRRRVWTISREPAPSDQSDCGTRAWLHSPHDLATNSWRRCELVGVAVGMDLCDGDHGCRVDRSRGTGDVERTAETAEEAPRG